MDKRRMQRAKSTGLVVFSALVAVGSGGCSSDTTDGAPQPQAPTAATLGAQSVLTTAEYLSTEPYVRADVENGERLAVLCLACHSLEQGGPHMIGPNLYGFFGTDAGARDGYEFSTALADADFVWTPRALDAWMAQPADFLPGNRMTFAGVRAPSDRADIIAYLLGATDREQQ